MCQQDCRAKLPPTVACTLEKATNIDTDVSFCAVYLGILTRSEGNKKCRSLNARFPLPKSKKDFNTFKFEFERLIPKDKVGYKLFVDMRTTRNSGTVQSLVKISHFNLKAIIYFESFVNQIYLSSSLSSNCPFF